MQEVFNSEMNNLEKRLTEARERAGLTQTRLAVLTGLKQSDISKIENGQSRKTTALPALARVLQCDVDWLDTGDGVPDWGRKLRGWPFRGIDRESFAALREDQQLEIQGIVRQAILGFEQAAANKAAA